MDWEQKYYDLLYENRKLKEEIEILKAVNRLIDKDKKEIIRFIVKNTLRKELESEERRINTK